MSKPRLHLAVSAVVLDPAVGDAGGSWIQLFAAGRNVGRAGEVYDVGDLATMRTIVAATMARAGSTDLVVDYDHQTIFGARMGVGGRAPASGWVKSLEARPDGIWAQVEWTAAAAAAIGAKEYRYISPTFLHTEDGSVRIIVNAALTNTPNFDLAEATAASAHLFADLTRETGETMKSVAKALGLAEDAPEDQILAAVEAQKTTLAAVATAAAEPDAAGQDLVLAVQSAIGERLDPTKFVPIEMLTTANARIAELTTTAATDKVTIAVDKAIADGKVAPAQKTWALGYAKADLAGFEAFVKTAPIIVAPTTQVRPVSGDPNTTGADLDATDLAVCTAMGLDPAAFKVAREKETR